MTKKKWSVIFFMLFTLFSIPSMAKTEFGTNNKADIEVDGFCYNIIDEDAKTLEVTYYLKSYTTSNSVNLVDGGNVNTNTPATYFYNGDIVIPKYVTSNGTKYKVVGIGGHAFVNCTGIASVYVPSTVEYIGSSAFSTSSSNTSAITPKSFDLKFEEGSVLREIGESAFRYRKVRQFNLPSSLEKIGKWAFNEALLSSLIIPKNVTYIGEMAFGACPALTKVKFEDGDKPLEIGYSAFNDAVLDNLVYPARLTILEMSSSYVIAFLEFEDSDVPLVLNRSGTFSSLKVYLGRNLVTSTGEKYTKKMFTTKEAVIGEKVTYIGEYFKESARITSIKFVGASSLESIPANAFYNCTELTSVEIPASVTSIGSNAFYGCKKLSTISSGIIKPFKISSSIFNDVNKNKCVLRVPFGTKEVYASTTYWNQFVNIQTDGGDADNTTTLDFTKPDQLNPQIEPSEDDGSGVDLTDECFTSDGVTYQLSLGKRTQAYSARLWTIDATPTYNLRVYEGANMTITAPKECNITNVLFYGDDIENLSSDKGSIANGVWTGNANSVTFTVNKANNKISSVVVYYSTRSTIDIADGSVYEQITNLEHQDITYTRNFKNTNWQALYVPFSMSYDDWKDDFEVARINNFFYKDSDDDGENDESFLNVTKVKSGTLNPNTPYLIRAKSTGEKTITLTDATLYAASIKPVVCTSFEETFTFQGTYAGVSGSEVYENGYYAMAGGTLKQAASSSANLSPYRWYVKEVGKASTTSYSKSRIINISVEGEDEETSIATLDYNNQPADKVYNLNGQIVGTSLESLTPGIYIKNGKKFVVK